MIPVLVFFIGAAIGSFINVIIYRLPRKISIVFPPSSCPACGKRIKFYDNIPILSYIILSGKCRFCKNPISPRYIIVESIAGIIPLFLYFRFGLSIDFLKNALYLFIMLPVAFIDLDTMLIPDSIAIPGIIVGLIISFFKGEIFFSITGALVGAISIIIIYFAGKMVFRKEAIGLGDIRLAAFIGSFTSISGFFISLFVASIIGSIYGVYIIVKKNKNLKTEIPFGPFLAIGGFITMIFGDYIIRIFKI